ncbi:hypothetical protein HN51_011145 [Arachis hypogaea]|uniref:B-like cyclin n=1 Tax=Arachis hypogaea TaxID=3818 RepID=A0A445E0I2_ARAHY|nr:putative cyclin-D6-1 [Arachis hypogaea]QHO56375.1 Putative cyclin [Arachis hypogaea]RYR68914.1 hypothetical protein Ahy_A03g015419 [Arachis hypogaea]
MEFDLENPLHNSHALPQWDAVASLFHIESQHTPSHTYFHSLKASNFNISVRRELISLISKFSCSLDPLVSYLSINYLDRFLSNHGIPKQKAWALRLLAISCISLASKMIKPGYSAIDTQALLMNDGGIIFETQTMQRMEGLILGALEWRMRSITPFSFLTFFITLICVKHPMEQVLKKRVAEIIFKSQGEIKLLEFKPSIIAASALLCASHELFPFQYQSFSAAISNCLYVNKENMVKCYNVIQEVVGMEMEEEECVINEVSSSGTPVNVLDLDHKFSLSSESEKTNNNGGMAIVVDDDDEEALQEKKDFIINKRRKMNNNNNNQTVHVSRIAQC